jgi:hypothetical protein
VHFKDACDVLDCPSPSAINEGTAICGLFTSCRGLILEDDVPYTVSLIEPGVYFFFDFFLLWLFSS